MVYPAPDPSTRSEPRRFVVSFLTPYGRKITHLISAPDQVAAERRLARAYPGQALTILSVYTRPCLSRAD
ncbi:hypothetical protein [Ruegeria sp.]|uniref:hypothetical protein n=1 Tax=Ruegeria sp. TaxID=1879320 RepID=UPI003AFF67CB